MKGKEIVEFLKINIINLFLVLFLYIINDNIFASTIIIFVYILFLLLQKNILKIVSYQFSVMVICSLVLDMTVFSVSTTPLWAKYISEMVSIILMIKILFDKNMIKLVFKDKIFLISLFVLSIGVIYSIFNSNLFYNIFDTYRRIFRFVPTYLIFSYKDIDREKLLNMFKLYFIINIIVFGLECFLGMSRDFRNGIFGKICTSGFNYFVLIFSAYNLVLYIEKKKSIFSILFVILASVILTVLQDGKSYMLCYFVSLFLIIAFFNKNFFKKISILILLIASIPFGMNIIKKVSPNATFFYNSNNLLKTAIEYITINNSADIYNMNRFEAVQYITDIEWKNPIKKIFGSGIGSSFPGENEFYQKNYFTQENSKSLLFNKYSNLGYHLSSMNLILLDFGILGLIIIIWIIIINIKKVFILNHSNDLFSKFIGLTLLMFIVNLIYNFFYGNQLFTREANYIVMLIIGLAHNLYLQNLKKEKEEM